jgi:hypothetical protein
MDNIYSNIIFTAIVLLNNPTPYGKIRVDIKATTGLSLVGFFCALLKGKILWLFRVD